MLIYSFANLLMQFFRQTLQVTAWNSQIHYFPNKNPKTNPYLIKRSLKPFYYKMDAETSPVWLSPRWLALRNPSKYEVSRRAGFLLCAEGSLWEWAARSVSKQLNQMNQTHLLAILKTEVCNFCTTSITKRNCKNSLCIFLPCCLISRQWLD